MNDHKNRDSYKIRLLLIIATSSILFWIYLNHRSIEIFCLKTIVIIGPHSSNIWAIKTSKSYGIDALPVLEAGLSDSETFNFTVEVSSKLKLLLAFPEDNKPKVNLRLKTREEALSGVFPGIEYPIFTVNKKRGPPIESSFQTNSK